MARTHWLWTGMWSASSVESSFTVTFSTWVNLAPQDWNSLRSRQPAKRWYKPIHKTERTAYCVWISLSHLGWQSSQSQQAGSFCCVQRRASCHEEMWHGSALCMEMQTLPCSSILHSGESAALQGRKENHHIGWQLKVFFMHFKQNMKQ